MSKYKCYVTDGDNDSTMSSKKLKIVKMRKAWCISGVRTVWMAPPNPQK